jgi:hypothetical protein
MARLRAFRRSAPAFISAALAAAAGLVLVYRFDPARVHFFPPCVFHALTGLQCPGCGSTRALHHLLHGDVAGAFRLNALLFAMPPFALASRSQRFATSPATGWAALAVVVGWWVVRNTALWPWPLP